MLFTHARIAAFATSAIALTVLPAPAAAQTNRDAVLNILVECAKIDDPTARLACFDSNIRNAGGTARSTVPGQARVQGGGAPVASNQGPAGFGGETVRTEQRSRAQAGEASSIRPKVTAAVLRQPGIYLVTIEDGAQWLFSDGVGQAYRPPRVGSIVEIERASMGSFLMRVDGQEPVRVRRVQ